jgi:hypothetical protein
MSTKSNRIISNKTIEKEDYLKGQAWNFDCTGRKDTPSIVTGARIGGVFVDKQSRYGPIYTFKNNDEKSILHILDRWNKEVLSFPKVWYAEQIKRGEFTFYLYSDNLEMRYPKVIAFLNSIGVKLMYTDPNKSSSNGLAERTIGVLDQMSRTMREARQLLNDFWEASFAHAAFLRNRMPITIDGVVHMDPYQAFFGHVFDYSKLKIFGSACWVKDYSIKKSEVKRAHRGIFIGIQPNSNSYLVFLPHRDKIIASGDVRFDELRENALELQPQMTEEKANDTETMSNLDDEAWMERALSNIADFLMRESA